MMKLYGEPTDVDELSDLILALRSKFPATRVYMEDDALVFELDKGNGKTKVDPFPTQIRPVYPYPNNDLNPNFHYSTTNAASDTYLRATK